MTIIQIIKLIPIIIGCIIVASVLIYLLSRIIGFAFAKSWISAKSREYEQYQIRKNQHQPKQEETNENKKQK